jgi:hypothetical protein
MMADLLPLIEGCLVGALVGWMAWRQHRQLDGLRALATGSRGSDG